MSVIPFFVGGAAGVLLGGPIGGAVGVGAGALVSRLMRGAGAGPDPFAVIGAVPRVSGTTAKAAITAFQSLGYFGDVAHLRAGEARRLTTTSAQGPAQMLTVVGRNGPVRVDARSFAARRGYGFINAKASSFLAPMPPPAPFTVMKSVTGVQAGPAAMKMALLLAQQNAPAATTNSTVSAGFLAGRSTPTPAKQDDAAIIAAKEAAAKAAAAEQLEALWKRMGTTTSTPNVSRELPPTTPEEAPPVMPAFPGTNESAPPNGVPQYLPRVGMSGATIAIGVGVLGAAAYFFTRKKGSTS